MAEEVPLVLADSTGHVVVLTLNQPDRKNPLNDEAIRALTAQLRTEQVRKAGLVVLRGAGRAFSAGGDISQFHASLTSDAAEQFDNTGDFREMLAALEGVEAITVAAVEGPALGGGCGLAAACDFAFASSSARFGCPEIKLGAFPMLIAPALVRAIGPRATMALSVLGSPVDAKTARALGLVHEVVDVDEFDSFIDNFVATVSAVPADVLRWGKMAVRSAMTSDYRGGLEAGSSLRSLLFSSTAFHEGVSSFVDRRRD